MAEMDLARTADTSAINYCSRYIIDLVPSQQGEKREREQLQSVRIRRVVFNAVDTIMLREECRCRLAMLL